MKRPTARDAHSTMTAAQFKAWRHRLGLSQHDVVRALGTSRRLVQYWEAGERPIPLVVALACAAYALGIRDYPEETR